METSESIAKALSRVREQLNNNSNIIHSANMSRADRELLSKTGWLQEIIKSWYMLVRPDIATGDTSVWYTNFWDFVQAYLSYRFKSDYCLSAESSLDIHTDDLVIPPQVIVIVKEGTGLRKLMYNTSLMIYADPKAFPPEVTSKKGLNIMKLAYALCKVPPSYFQRNQRNAEIALRIIKNPTELSKMIAKYNFKAAANRIIGAYKFLQNNTTVEDMTNDLSSIGFSIRHENPFAKRTPLISVGLKCKSPYAGRIYAMWSEARDDIISNFPIPPGLPNNKKVYLYNIDEIYQQDAYNSLSIEGYQVTSELINIVRNNQWDPSNNAQHYKLQNALAAKGYFETFQQVKICVENIINGKNAAKIVKDNLQKWYQSLFSPAVKAGLIKPNVLIGYRDDRVFIRNSRHSPPPKEAVPDAMEAFFDCLQKETHPGVNAVLGHYFFAFIHPYMDGNGRIARFLMNTMLASGGYPWTIINVKNRKEYIDVLEETHMNFSMKDFSCLIKKEMNRTTKLLLSR